MLHDHDTPKLAAPKMPPAEVALFLAQVFVNASVPSFPESGVPQ
jgi:hypothetical protein